MNATRIGLEKEEREKERTFPQKFFPSRIWLVRNRLCNHKEIFMPLVKNTDPLGKKLKWWFIAFLFDTLILFIFVGGSLIAFFYCRHFIFLVFFIISFFLSGKIIFTMENYIGVQCCLQNPNRFNLVQIEIKIPFPWLKSQKRPENDKSNIHNLFNKKNNEHKRIKNIK